MGWILHTGLDTDQSVAMGQGVPRWCLMVSQPSRARAAVPGCVVAITVTASLVPAPLLTSPLPRTVAASRGLKLVGEFSTLHFAA